MIHTREQRIAIAREHLNADGPTRKAIAKRERITLNTVYKWTRLFKAELEADLPPMAKDPPAASTPTMTRLQETTIRRFRTGALSEDEKLRMATEFAGAPPMERRQVASKYNVHYTTLYFWARKFRLPGMLPLPDTRESVAPEPEPESMHFAVNPRPESEPEPELVRRGRLPQRYTDELTRLREENDMLRNLLLLANSRAKREGLGDIFGLSNGAR